MADPASKARDKRREQQKKKVTCVNCQQVMEPGTKICPKCKVNPKVVKATFSQERKPGGIKVRVDKQYGYYRRGAHAH